MKVCLVNPRGENMPPLSDKLADYFPPLALSVLAAHTPPGVELNLVDELVSPLNVEEPWDLVGISVITRHAPRAYCLADELRRRGVKVVLGGMHVSALPQEAAAHADAVIIGEGELSWPQAIQDLGEGGLRRCYRQEGHLSLDRWKPPRRDLLPPHAYALNSTVMTARGCPYDCDFCTVTATYGPRLRTRPVAQVVAEIQSLGSELVIFIDDNIAGDPRRAKELFSALIPLRIRWAGQASVNIAQDDELLSLARRSGCFCLFIGFESLSPQALRSMHKRPNRPSEYGQAIAKLHHHGIAVFGAFIFGFDEDDEGVFEATVRFAQRHRLEMAQFGILTPYPGTRLYDQMVAQGRLLTRDWAQYHLGNVVFRPAKMTPERLLEGHDWAYREFYRLSSVVRRTTQMVGRPWQAAQSVWAYNWHLRGSDPTSWRRRQGG